MKAAPLAGWPSPILAGWYPQIKLTFIPVFQTLMLVFFHHTQIDTVMNRNFFAGLFVGLGLLGIFAFRPAGNEKPSAVQKWEYKVVRNIRSIGTLVGVQSKMNELGAQGWEFVSVDDGRHIYKRPAE